MLQKQCRDALNTLQRNAGKFRATPQAKVDACKIILDVTGFPGGVRAVKCSGVIAVLCKLLRDGYRNEKEAAADVLARLAAEPLPPPWLFLFVLAAFFDDMSMPWF